MVPSMKDRTNEKKIIINLKCNPLDRTLGIIQTLGFNALHTPGSTLRNMKPHSVPKTIELDCNHLNLITIIH